MTSYYHRNKRKLLKSWKLKSCPTEHWPPYRHLWLKHTTAHYLWSNYFKSCASVRMSLVIWRICGYHIKADLLHQEPLTVRRTFNKVYIMKNVISKPHICRYDFDSAVSFDEEWFSRGQWGMSFRTLVAIKIIYWQPLTYMQPFHSIKFSSHLEKGGYFKKCLLKGSLGNQYYFSMSSLPKPPFTFTFTFSRHFYPKRLTVHSGYTFFVSMFFF